MNSNPAPCICKDCGFENQPGARFCSSCGRSLAERSPLAAFFLSLLAAFGYYAFFVFMQYATISLFALSAVVGRAGFSPSLIYEGLIEYSGYRDHINEIGIVSGILTISGYLIFFCLRKKSFAKAIRLRSASAKGLCACAALGVTAQIVTSVAVALVYLIFFSGAVRTDPSTNAIFESSGVVLQLLNVALVTGFTEEILFRGLIYNTMKEAMPTGFAVFLSSLIFGAAHGDVEQFIYTALLGILLTLIYEKYDSILAPIIMHAFFNGSTLLLNQLPFRGLTPYVALAVFALGISLIILIFVFFSKKIPQKSLNIIKE